jgi:5-methylcytosine-specific restriction endonuclease McrA
MSRQGRRSAPLPDNWHKTRARILRRDNNQCQRVLNTGDKCGEHATHVDHITPASQGGGDDDANLQALCIYCHGQKTGAEGAAAAARVPRPSRRRDTERHPGIIYDDD